MKDTTKRYLLIGGSILVLGGVAYWFYRNAKKKKELKASEEAAAAAVAAAALEAITQPSTTPSSAATTSAPSELNTTDKIKAFQDYMDTVGNWVKNPAGKYVKLNKGTGYGVYGPSTQAAWNAYGKQYLESLKGNSDYDQFKKNVKEAKEKKSADGTTFLAVPLSNNRFVEIYKNGRFWFNQFVPVGGKIVPKNLSKGNYANAGKKMVVTEGLKKGSTFETTSFWDTAALLK